MSDPIDIVGAVLESTSLPVKTESVAEDGTTLLIIGVTLPMSDPVDTVDVVLESMSPPVETGSVSEDGTTLLVIGATLPMSDPMEDGVVIDLVISIVV